MTMQWDKVRAFLDGWFTSSKFEAGLLDGIWFGETTFDETKTSRGKTTVLKTSVMFRKSFRPGNRLTTEFKFKYADGDTHQITQTGRWTLSDGKLTTVLSDQYGETHAEYWMLKLAKNMHTYRSVGDNKYYIAKKATERLESKWHDFLPDS